MVWLLFAGAAGSPIRLAVGQRDATLVVDASVALDLTRGVVLQSVPAFTHSFDQNQRHVRARNIRVANIGGSSNALVTFDVPASPVIVPGVHYLFLVSAAGVPSVARFAIVG